MIKRIINSFLKGEVDASEAWNFDRDYYDGLLRAKNCYITRNNSIKKRPGIIPYNNAYGELSSNLFANAFDLISFDGKIFLVEYDALPKVSILNSNHSVSQVPLFVADDTYTTFKNIKKDNSRPNDVVKCITQGQDALNNPIFVGKCFVEGIIAGGSNDYYTFKERKPVVLPDRVLISTNRGIFQITKWSSMQDLDLTPGTGFDNVSNTYHCRSLFTEEPIPQKDVKLNSIIEGQVVVTESDWVLRYTAVEKIFPLLNINELPGIDNSVYYSKPASTVNISPETQLNTVELSAKEFLGTDVGYDSSFGGSIKGTNNYVKALFVEKKIQNENSGNILNRYRLARFKGKEIDSFSDDDLYVTLDYRPKQNEIIFRGSGEAYDSGDEKEKVIKINKDLRGNIRVAVQNDNGWTDFTIQSDTGEETVTLFDSDIDPNYFFDEFIVSNLKLDKDYEVYIPDDSLKNSNIDLGYDLKMRVKSYPNAKSSDVAYVYIENSLYKLTNRLKQGSFYTFSRDENDFLTKAPFKDGKTYDVAVFIGDLSTKDTQGTNILGSVSQQAASQVNVPQSLIVDPEFKLVPSLFFKNFPAVGKKILPRDYKSSDEIDNFFPDDLNLLPLTSYVSLSMPPNPTSLDDELHDETPKEYYISEEHYKLLNLRDRISILNFEDDSEYKFIDMLNFSFLSIPFDLDEEENNVVENTDYIVQDGRKYYKVFSEKVLSRFLNFYAALPISKTFIEPLTVLEKFDKIEYNKANKVGFRVLQNTIIDADTFKYTFGDVELLAYRRWQILNNARTSDSLLKFADGNVSETQGGDQVLPSSSFFVSEDPKLFKDGYFFEHQKRAGVVFKNKVYFSEVDNFTNFNSIYKFVRPLTSKALITKGDTDTNTSQKVEIASIAKNKLDALLPSEYATTDAFNIELPSENENVEVTGVVKLSGTLEEGGQLLIGTREGIFKVFSRQGNLSAFSVSIEKISNDPVDGQMIPIDSAVFYVSEGKPVFLQYLNDKRRYVHSYVGIESRHLFDSPVKKIVHISRSEGLIGLLLENGRLITATYFNSELIQGFCEWLFTRVNIVDIVDTNDLITTMIIEQDGHYMMADLNISNPVSLDFPKGAEVNTDFTILESPFEMKVKTTPIIIGHKNEERLQEITKATKVIVGGRNINYLDYRLTDVQDYQRFENFDPNTNLLTPTTKNIELTLPTEDIDDGLVIDIVTNTDLRAEIFGFKIK